jgi:DNA mismatch repair protein MutS
MSKKKDETEPVETNKITKEYFDLSKEYTAKYGKETIVLLQVGAFFEVYGLKDESGKITESNIEEFANMCQLNIADKKLVYNSKQIVMAGFRDYVLDKNLQKITEYGYTAVVYVQEKDGKNIKRILHGVFSAGTYISCETDSLPQITNNIMCIWIDKYAPLKSVSSQMTPTNIRDTIIYGVATTNIFTGKSNIFEYQTPFILNPTTFDELERYISVYSPSEILFVSCLEPQTNQTILNYSGIKTTSIHIYDSNDVKNISVFNCMKQKYINHILSTFYGEDAMNICKEFQTYSLATQSFCFLLNFLQEHNQNLVRKISIPVFNNTSDRMVLANHTLKQLNIIDDMSIDGKKSGQLSSVLSLLNKCCSPMGRRLFQSQFLNPTKDEEWLTSEYNMIDTILEEKNNYFIEFFRKQLGQIRDIEKIIRQIVLHKIYPSSIYQLYKSIFIIKQINTCLVENQEICSYLCNDMDISSSESAYQYIDEITSGLLTFMEAHFNIEECKLVNSMSNYEQNIIKTGVSPELDALINDQQEKIAMFECIKHKLNKLIHANGQNPDTEYIKTHETEKSGLSLQITKTRASLLKSIIKKLLEQNADSVITLNELGLETSNKQLQIYLRDIKISNVSTNAEEIEIPFLNKICKEMMHNKEKINTLMGETYIKILKKMTDELFGDLEIMVKFIAKVDVLQCKSYIAQKYHYCKPEIMNTGSQKSFVNAVQLRHCLIERIQQNELYVTNDVVLGKEKDGMLLYGTNAVGKTSFIRALGISIIMAQSGMFVPCSQFQYKPYTAIYSRILGNDNIFKGLSTFAVEMSELRIILKMADDNSLILGDELCSGTETESALSIFVAGLMDLHSKQSSFLFATHFHEIIHYDEVKTLDRLSLNHMSVLYDRERDCLVYDRKLKDGPGTKTYGLEVCKSLYLTDDFLEKAYAIRNKYYPETHGELTKKTTKYNANKIRGNCEICKVEMGEEIHHLQEQHEADANGFIGHIHKNNMANLVSICKNCHYKIHHDNSVTNETKLQRKKTTKGYMII